MNKQEVFSLLVLAMIALGQAAPTNPTPDASSTSVPTTAPIKISAIKVSAIQETYAVFTEIRELENHTVRYVCIVYSYNLYKYCYFS